METILPITLSFFGTPRLERDKNIPIHLARRKSLALLVYLAVTSQPQSRDTLAALLWPDYDSSSARANLRRALADLRQVLKKNCLVVEREHIQLICNPNLRMDVAEFTDRITKWRDHAHARLDCSECQIMLKEAISLYTADFLAGFTLPDCPEFDNWQYQQREMLRSDLLAALAWLVEAHEVKNEYIAAIAYARRWISVDPLHENAHYTLMRLFALSGQRSAALRQYAECEHLLKEGLGITPQKETRELFRAIMQKCDLAPITTGSTIENASSQRYQLREKIRQDEMGAVYRAFDTILEREVAIKLLEKATLDAEGRANLLREARTAAKLNHPNIISVFDAGELNGTPFLVRELAEGDTLRDRLSAPLDEKLRWMVQICKALEHAHGLGILHCGLTFENIFISTDGRVRLADFGLARGFESPQFTQKHRLEETSPYLAPEQLNNGEVGVRTDLYALGVIFYELVTGNMPFVGQNPVFIITQDPHVIPTAHIQISPQNPTSLEILIQQLLHKLPEDRPGSATEVRQALEKLLQVNPLTGQIIDPQARLKMPIHVIPFISREDLLTEIQERLTDPECRLLTLVGPGGSGKTRLALETGKQQEDNFANGVFFVSL